MIGFEGDGDSNVWVLCDNLLVLVARDRLRPCNSAELLAFQYMQQQKTDEGPERATRYRDKYVDESDRQQKKAKTDSDQQLSRATTFTGGGLQTGGSSSSTAPPPTAEEGRNSTAVPAATASASSVGGGAVLELDPPVCNPPPVKVVARESC